MSNEPGKSGQDPQVAEAWKAAEAGRLDEADRLFERACTGPSAGDAYNGRGAVAAKRGDFARAAELFEQACRLSPKEPLFQYQLGVAMLSTGRPDAAIRAFEACVGLDPDFGHAWFNLVQHETIPSVTTMRSRRFGAPPRPLDRSSRPNPLSARCFDPPAGSTTRSPRPARRSPGTTAPRRLGTNLGFALPRRATSTPPRPAGIGCLNSNRDSTKCDFSEASRRRLGAGSTTRSAAIAICCRAIRGTCGVA